MAPPHGPRTGRCKVYGVVVIFSAKKIVKILAEAIPSGSPLHEPEIAGNERVYVEECLKSGWVSPVGAFVDRFEGVLADYTGAGYAVACVNGTAALHTCLLMAGVASGDEVIIPTLTFVATANAVAYCGAVPHFADSEEATLGLDPAKLEKYLERTAHITQGKCFNRRTGKRIAAVVCMHTFGHPVDIDPLIKVCRHFKLPLIEDAAESLGSFYKDRHTGRDGLLSALSFNGNKIITTGGGGAVLTNDKELAKAARHLTTTAKLPHRWEFIHDRVGFNYRMPNINAAIGCAQMEQLPGFIDRKRRLARRYGEAFAGIAGVRFFHEPQNCRSNYWLNALILEKEHAGLRDSILEAANDAGVMTRPTWRPMHHLEMYKNCPSMNLDVAEDLYARIINIPSSPNLENDS